MTRKPPHFHDWAKQEIVWTDGSKITYKKCTGCGKVLL